MFQVNRSVSYLKIKLYNIKSEHKINHDKMPKIKTDFYKVEKII